MGVPAASGDKKKRTFSPNPQNLRAANPARFQFDQRLVRLVEQMLDLHKRLAATTLEGDREAYQRQIDATDREIDKLVYELYGLTREEIAIVEGASE